MNLGVWVVRLAVKLAITPLTGLVVEAATRGLGFKGLSAWPLVASAPVFILAMDLAEYLYHRAQHAIPWLWRRHALHHSDPCVSATTTERHWWGDLVLKAVLFGMPLAVLLQPTPADYAVYGALSLWNYLVHANLALGFGRWSFLINSPAYHRLHHARAPEHHGANFAALFPIFDVLTGSYRRPTEALETGLDEQPATLAEALAWPPQRAEVATA
jgi:sterol desaturase/sphingolipid hydroxylase (fatty acid hydroxylase superfamily)